MAALRLVDTYETRERSPEELDKIRSAFRTDHPELINRLRRIQNYRFPKMTLLELYEEVLTKYVDDPERLKAIKQTDDAVWNGRRAVSEHGWLDASACFRMAYASEILPEYKEKWRQELIDVFTAGKKKYREQGNYRALAVLTEMEARFYREEAARAEPVA